MNAKPARGSRWIEGTRRFALRVGLPVALLAGAAVLARASVPHTFSAGETLQATDLNDDLGALDKRIAALESNSLVGTYPAVMSLGMPTQAGGASLYSYSCGSAPPSLVLSSTPPDAGLAASNGFGSVVFTNGGALALDLGPPPEACTNSADVGFVSGHMCAPPITYFLNSPKAQTIQVTAFLDDAGSIYVDGVAQLTNLGTAATSSITVPSGAFALTFLACSVNGPSIALVIYDAFLANPAYGLTVDYDRTFHRNGK